MAVILLPLPGFGQQLAQPARRVQVGQGPRAALRQGFGRLKEAREPCRVPPIRYLALTALLEAKGRQREE
jgi:hypothetical protein